MFKLIAVFSALFAVASAGYIGGYGLSGYGHGLSGYGYGHGLALSAPAYHAPVVAAPVIKSYAAPIVHAAPIYKSYAAPIVHAPVATSYANTYKISQKAIPVVHAAPAIVSAPVIKSYAAPAYVAGPALGYGYGHHGGYASYGHSVYH